MNELYDFTNVNILFVEDEEDSVFVVAEVLKYRHANVFISKSAREAYDIIDSQRLDIILTDIYMPEISGWQLIKAIRGHSNDQIRRIPVIVLTAQLRLEDRTKVLEAGFTDFLTKAIEPRDLLRCLDQYVSEGKR